MIRFIDLTDQIDEGGKEFAFFDTITGCFVEVSGYQTFTSWGDLIDCYNEDAPENQRCPLQRLTSLIPNDEKWD